MFNINQVIAKGEEWINNAINNGWAIESKPNIKKWAENKVANLPFSVEEWDWYVDLLNYLTYVWCQYGATRKLIVISSADWCGGRQCGIFVLSDEDYTLQDYDYVEWRGTTHSLLVNSPDLKEVYCPQYEDQYTVQTSPKELFANAVFVGEGLRTL